MLEQDEEHIAEEVFADLHSQFTYITDQQSQGLPDYWSFSHKNLTDKMLGDCEDFAMTAQHMLAEHGVNSRLVAVHDWDGSDHMITITEHGWVLDNMLIGISTLQQVGYDVIKQSGFLGDTVWHAVSQMVQ